MTSVDRLRRLGGVSLLVLSAIAAGAVLERTAEPAFAQEAPRFAAAVPNGAPMSFADLIESVSPAVVTIQAQAEPDAAQVSPDMEGIPPQFREWLERQFGDRAPQQAQPRQSLGSGFFISADGHIVTNNHVVANASEITIGLSNGEDYPARIVGLDPLTDLALLKVDADVEFPYVTLAENPNYRVGDWVVAVGNPFGLGGTATAGIISATGREIGNTAHNEFIQIDAPINRGNSGGPTFDLNGNVVGVNSQIFSPTGGNVGIGFAIPSDTASRIIGQLLENGRVSRGWLGVSIQNVTPDIAAALGLEEPRGAIVSAIVAGGPAANAGIEREDVVLEVNGHEVENSRDLTQRIASIAAGERVSFRVLRDGRERTIRAMLGDRPTDQELTEMRNQGEAEVAEVAVFGMRLVPMGQEDRELRGIAEGTPGLVIDDVDTSSEAARKGLSTGDVILEAGGEPVGDVDELQAVIEDARDDSRSAILLLVESRGGQRYVALELDEAE